MILDHLYVTFSSPLASICTFSPLHFLFFLTFFSKWKVGTERVTCLLVLSDSNSLLAAGYTICLWDIPSKKVVRRFTGHASEVTSLTLIPGTENYFVSAAKNDRLISAW
jgi:WD40 repeat protein